MSLLTARFPLLVSSCHHSIARVTVAISCDIGADLEEDMMVCCMNGWVSNNDTVTKEAPDERGDADLAFQRKRVAPIGPLRAESNVCIEWRDLDFSMNTHFSCPMHSDNGNIRAARVKVERIEITVFRCILSFQSAKALSSMYNSTVKASVVQMRPRTTEAS
jgi:hypothetical protein